MSLAHAEIVKLMVYLTGNLPLLRRTQPTAVFHTHSAVLDPLLQVSVSTMSACNKYTMQIYIFTHHSQCRQICIDTDTQISLCVCVTRTTHTHMHTHTHTHTHAHTHTHTHTQSHNVGLCHTRLQRDMADTSKSRLYSCASSSILR